MGLITKAALGALTGGLGGGGMAGAAKGAGMGAASGMGGMPAMGAKAAMMAAPGEEDAGFENPGIAALFSMLGGMGPGLLQGLSKWGMGEYGKKKKEHPLFGGVERGTEGE